MSIYHRSIPDDAEAQSSGEKSMAIRAGAKAFLETLGDPTKHYATVLWFDDIGENRSAVGIYGSACAEALAEYAAMTLAMALTGVHEDDRASLHAFFNRRLLSRIEELGRK